MSRIRLFHWKPAEARACIEALEAEGHAVIYREPTEKSSLTGWRDDAPDAFVVDLSRSPSHGRAIGMALRKTRTSRALPLVFAGGADDKVAAVRATLPDAVYTPWSAVGAALGMSQYKVCAISAAWSAMVFRTRGLDGAGALDDRL